VHEEAKKRGEDVNCSYLLGGESDAIVPDITTTTNSEPSQFLSKLHLKQYPKENALLSFFLSFFLRPLGGPDSRLQKYSKIVFLLYRRSVSQQFLPGFEVPSRGGGTENPGRPYFETLLWRKESVERFCNFLVTLIFLIIFLMHFSSPSSLTHFMLFSYNMISATRSIFFLCRFSNDLHFLL
jgi:hypothetical protein